MPAVESTSLPPPSSLCLSCLSCRLWPLFVVLVSSVMVLCLCCAHWTVRPVVVLWRWFSAVGLQHYFPLFATIHVSGLETSHLLALSHLFNSHHIWTSTSHPLALHHILTLTFAATSEPPGGSHLVALSPSYFLSWRPSLDLKHSTSLALLHHLIKLSCLVTLLGVRGDYLPPYIVNWRSPGKRWRS